MSYKVTDTRSSIVDKNGKSFKEDPIRDDKIKKQQSIILSPYNPISRYFPQNPDDIYRKKNSLELYYDMLKDAQVKAIVELKKNLVLGDGWDIQLPTDSEGNELLESKPQYEFVKENLEERMASSLDEGLWGILSAHDFGFSVSELIYRGENGKVWLSEIKQIPPDSVEFRIDDYGNLEKEGFFQWTKVGKSLLSVDKFVIFLWAKRDGNAYGESALRAVYKEWFIKTQVIKWWAMYLERHGFPFILGRYSSDLERTETAQLKEVIESFQVSTSALVPQDVEIEFKEFSQNSADSYEKSISYLNTEIAKGLITPDLMGFSGKTEGGSYALGKKQFEILQMMNQRYRRSLEESVVNKQIIKRLVDINFPNTKFYPKFRFKPAKDEDSLEKLKTFIEFSKLNAFKITEQDIAFMREALGLPESDIELKDMPDFLGGEQQTREAPFKFEIKEDPDYKAVFAEKWVDFKKIDSDFKERTEIAIGKIEKIIQNIKREVIRNVLDQKILEKGKTEAVDKIQIPMIGNIKTQFEKLFLGISFEGIKDTQTEIQRQIPDKKFGIIDEFLSISGSKEFLRKLALTKAIQEAGNFSDIFKRGIRQVLISGFAEGKKTEDIIVHLEELFAPYVGGVVRPTASMAPHRLENVVRTNASTFYNQGRVAGFKEAAKEGLVTHYEFSAILDDRTSEICAELHGTVVPATDSGALKIITPPRHYNCRSILIPITKYRQEDMQERLKEPTDDGGLKSGLNKPPDFYDGF